MKGRIAFVVLVAAAATAIAGVAAGKSPAPGTSTGTGTVFLPNPVADLQNESLTDQKDADYAALQPAYHTVALTDLDGSGTLTGRWAQIVSETGVPARSSTNTFTYHRNDDRFEQVMAYYWITRAQRYIQSLGFGTGAFPPVNMRSQRVRINQYGQDNSFATDHPKDELRFGKGGVDDAEDAEVILHEYGHAIHFSQNFSFASEEAGAISEGFGDYWAADVSSIVAPTPDPACVADWDSVSYTSAVPHCLRRVDADLHYPDDLSGEVHHDGQIWSRALWDIRGALGHVEADTIILNGQFDFPGTTMTDLAARTVAAAQSLYGTSAANAVTAAFEARGIL
ncbi:MAG: M36 family metallopeptidase [Verrucomicrobiota bacterium]